MDEWYKNYFLTKQIRECELYLSISIFGPQMNFLKSKISPTNCLNFKKLHYSLIKLINNVSVLTFLQVIQLQANVL